MLPKKTSKKLFLTIFGIFIFQTSFSQENYLPGYFLKLNGDTVHGLIDYRNWERNPTKIAFRKEIGATVSYFTPLDIKGFAVSDEIYESAIVKTETTSNITNNLLYESELQIKKDTAFLQAMIIGVKSLYQYSNKFDKMNFYIKLDTSYQLLIYKRYLGHLEEIESRKSTPDNYKPYQQQAPTRIFKNLTYVGQLILYLQDCPFIVEIANQTLYHKESLEDLFEYYYTCTKDKITFQKKTEKLRIQYGALAGVTLTTLSFVDKTQSHPEIYNAGYKPSLNISAGVNMELVLPRNNGKWSVYNEFIMTSSKFEGSYTDYYNPDYYFIYNSSLKYTYLKMNNMVRLKYFIGHYKLFFNAGLSNGWAILNKNHMELISRLYAPEIKTEVDALRFTKKWERGICAGMGVKQKRFTAEMRYETGNGMSDVNNLTSRTKRFYCLIGYGF